MLTFNAMTMPLRSHYDAIIFGAGAAGAFLFAALDGLGFRVLLLDPAAPGGQTPWSQGIIHSGIKYAGIESRAEVSRMLAPMPDTWRSLLAGSGQPDLSQLEVLSQEIYLWAEQSPQLASHFASLESQKLAERLGPAEYPAAFAASCSLFRVSEPVINPHSLTRVLTEGRKSDTAALADGCVCRFQPMEDGMLASFDGEPIHAKRLIFAAGSGNPELLRRAGFEPPEMQLRPLHQVFCRLPGEHKFYGHFLHDIAKGPALTVTTCRSGDYTLFHLGGELAETGVPRSQAAQIQEAAKLLRQALPGLDLQEAEWSSKIINRAEPAGHAGGCFLREYGPCFLFWPVKLALIPLAVQPLADSLGTPDPVSLRIQVHNLLPTRAAPPPLEACQNWMRP